MQAIQPPQNSVAKIDKSDLVIEYEEDHRFDVDRILASEEVQDEDDEEYSVIRQPATIKSPSNVNAAGKSKLPSLHIPTSKASDSQINKQLKNKNELKLTNYQREKAKKSVN